MILFPLTYKTEFKGLGMEKSRKIFLYSSIRPLIFRLFAQKLKMNITLFRISHVGVDFYDTVRFFTLGSFPKGGYNQQ
jgi:hypothetical protein